MESPLTTDSDLGDSLDTLLRVYGVRLYPSSCGSAIIIRDWDSPDDDEVLLEVFVDQRKGSRQ